MFTCGQVESYSDKCLNCGGGDGGGGGECKRLIDTEQRQQQACLLVVRWIGMNVWDGVGGGGGDVGG